MSTIRRRRYQATHRTTNRGAPSAWLGPVARDHPTSHSRWTPRLSLLFGVALVMVCFGSSISSAQPRPPSVRLSDYANARTVEAAVRQAESLISAPRDAVSQLEALAKYEDFGDQLASATCPGPSTFLGSEDVPRCTFGDLEAKRTLVLTGDSRAQMWFDTIDSIASANHLKLVFLAKSGCPSALGTYKVNNNGPLEPRPWQACAAWQKFVTSTIRALRPQVVIVSSSEQLEFTSGLASPQQETVAYSTFFRTIHAPTKLAVLGGFPTPGPAEPTLCLSRGPKMMKSCAFQESPATVAANGAIQAAARGAGAAYINQTPWLCAMSCPALIAGIIPYTIDGYHIDDTYAHYLTGVLWTALEPELR